MRDLISRFLRNHVQYLKNNDDVLEDALHRSTREVSAQDSDPGTVLNHCHLVS
jgi:hypothetical protein